MDGTPVGPVEPSRASLLTEEDLHVQSRFAPRGSSEGNLQPLGDFAMDVVVKVVRNDDLLVLNACEYVPSFRRPVQLEEGPLDLRDDAPVEPGMNGKGLWRDLFSPRENGEFLALRRIERIETPGDDAGGHRLAVEDRPERRIVRARVNCLDLVRRHASAGERKSTRLNSSHGYISYAVFCLKKKKTSPLATPSYR